MTQEVSAGRLDQVLVERGLVESRARAQRIIRAGGVRVDGRVVEKPAAVVAAACFIELEGKDRFVGRGGDKLDFALAHFELSVEGLRVLDVGASTGGFTDCLLQHGAAD